MRTYEARLNAVAVTFAALVVGLLAAPAAAPGQSLPESLDARELYGTACAACHGPDGRGIEPSVLGFDTPLPDFTDCSFATPEPDVDWMAVMHSG